MSAEQHVLEARETRARLEAVVVVGNPKPRSRTMTVAQKLAEALLGNRQCLIETIDLADYGTQLLTWPNETVNELSEKVANADIAFIASPTYKAGYTGLLKSFLDRYQTNGLAGVVTIPVMTGADKSHSMSPTVNLAPLLMELGAVVPGRGFYFIVDQLDNVDEVVNAAARVYEKNLRLISNIFAERHDAAVAHAE